MYQSRLGSNVLLDGSQKIFYNGKNLFFGLPAGFVYDLEDEDARRQEAEFHIRRGDYFATLATICHIAAYEKGIDIQKIFGKLAKDLQYLQDNYEIKRKKQPQKLKRRPR